MSVDLWTLPVSVGSSSMRRFAPTHWVERACLWIARRERLSVESYAALVMPLFEGLGSYISAVTVGLLVTCLRVEADPCLFSFLMLAAMVASAGLRLVQTIAFKRWERSNRKTVESGYLPGLVRGEATYAVLATAMTAIIGVSTALSVDGRSDPFSLAVSITVTIGLVGGIASRHGSRPVIVASMVFSACFPFIVSLLFVGTTLARVCAALTVLVISAALSSTKSQYHLLRTAIVNEENAMTLSRSVRRAASQLDMALNSMNSGLLMFDSRFRLAIANDRIKAMWGSEVIEPLRGASSNIVQRVIFASLAIPPEEVASLRRMLRHALTTRSDAPLPFMDHRNRRALELKLSLADGGGVVVTVDDVTEKRTKDQEIYRLAHRDGLTGMANRFDLAKQMDVMIAKASSPSSTVAMVVDLDGFKRVNEHFGPAVGDELLVKVAERITDHTRRSDLIARVGGDEFVVCFRDAHDFEAISNMAHRLIDEIARPYLIDGKTVEIGASAGLAVTNAKCATPDEVLRLAEVALYEGRTGGRGRAIWFDTAMDDRARENREITQELRAALDAGELTLHYQPVIDFRTGRIVCCEALTRWTSRTRGTVPPSVFIPLAEATDLIHRLGDWSLARACEDAAQWPDPTIKVAVNFSAAQFKRPAVARRVREIVGQSALPTSRLEIEITETTLAEDLEAMKIEMDGLQAAGISIALDDFGMGYSSLSYLHNLPIQKVKLDASFVRQLRKDPTAIALVASIVQMTNIMRKELVIEGVETAEELALIAHAQARLIQGYHFSRPLPQADVIAFIEARAARADYPAAETADAVA